MKKIQIAIATLAMMTVSAIATYAQNAPTTPAPTPGSGQPRGKRLGPKDGSGPIHTPGTGGGTGAGQRRGRR